MDDLEETGDFIFHLLIRIVVLNVEVCLQDIYDRVIGYVPAVGDTFSFQEGYIFGGHSLTELIEEPRLTDTCLGDDGDGLGPPLP